MLPTTLQQQLSLFCNSRIISTVPLFANVPSHVASVRAAHNVGQSDPLLLRHLEHVTPTLRQWLLKERRTKAKRGSDKHTTQ